MRITSRNGRAVLVAALASAAVVACGDDSNVALVGGQTAQTTGLSSSTIAGTGSTSTTGELSATTGDRDSVDFNPSFYASDLAFWRSLSMRADWIYATRSFSEMLDYSDIVVLASVVDVTQVPALDVKDLNTQLTNVDLHLKVVSGAVQIGITDLVLRMEAPGSLTAKSAEEYEAWFKNVAQQLPGNVGLFILRQRPDAPANVFQILNEWSIWIQTSSGVTTAFDEEDLSDDLSLYRTVTASTATLDDLFWVLQDSDNLVALENG